MTLLPSASTSSPSSQHISRPATMTAAATSRPDPKASKAKGGIRSLPGGNKALAAFALSLLAYTLQTEAAQYVQQGLGYRKPFLSLWLGHSGFMILFPAHLLLLKWHSGLPISHYLHLVAQNLHWQLSTPTRHLDGDVQENIRRRLSSVSGRTSADGGRSSQGDGRGWGDDECNGRQGVEESSRRSWRQSLHAEEPVYRSYFEVRYGFDVPKFVLLLLVLMVGITIPALSWYCAVPMTSMADITALYNTFSVWALVFSVWFLGEKWSRFKVLSVVMACGGVIVVAYGGAEHRRKPKELDPVYGQPPAPTTTTTTTLPNPTASPTGVVIRAMVDFVADAIHGQMAGRDADGGSGGGDAGGDSDADSAANPLLGDCLALFGAVTMAAYEMAFKLLGTLPDEDVQREKWDAVRSTQGRRSIHRSRRGESWRGDEEAHCDNDDDEAGEGQGLLSHQDHHGLSADVQYRSSGRTYSTKVDDQEDETQHVLVDDGGDVTLDADSNEGLGSRTKDTVQTSSLLPNAHDERTAIWTSSQEGDLAGGTPDYGSGRAGASSPVGGNSGGASDARKGEWQASDEHGTTGEDDAEEEESILDEGDAEEIRAGSTRLGRPKSRARLNTPGTIPAEGISKPARAHEAGGDVADEGTRRVRGGTGAGSQDDARWIPPPLPFGLHANTMTAGIGLVTFCVLWIGVVLAHLTNLEPFELPHNFLTLFALFFVVFAGVLFNGAFMLLLALWGPVTASVSCLLSTVAVALLDGLLATLRAQGGGFNALSLVGCAFIVGGFGVLLLDES